MAKFFNTIRKKLIKQNEVRHYFLYALGEIVLVVIGILIALQINGWNQERKNRLEEEQYLARLHRDFEEAVRKQEEKMDWLNERLYQIEILVEVLNGREPQPEEIAGIDNAIASLWPTLRSMDRLVTLLEMRSNGKLQLIRDVDLRNALENFDLSADAYQKVIEKSLDLQLVYHKALIEPITTYKDFRTDPPGRTFAKYNLNELRANSSYKKAIEAKYWNLTLSKLQIKNHFDFTKEVKGKLTKAIKKNIEQPKAILPHQY
ncbi:MAG: DUF6090 family protein [Tunicatimonas sp.]|uniref:DUF6090 family protein n=1 Tax=Tunicatimonas sp. TaxID=1940096 RepID=UPI003C75BAF0